MGHTIECKYCDFDDAWSTRRAAEADAVWHVYYTHNDLWKDFAGDRPPKDPRPETLGRRLLTQERQS